MEFYITNISDKTITVRARTEDENGNLLGDLMKDLTPGSSIFGYSFEQLKEMGPGVHKMRGQQDEY